MWAQEASGPLVSDATAPAVMSLKLSPLEKKLLFGSAGHGTKSSILYLHSSTVWPVYIVRLSEDPLIQDSLSDLHSIVVIFACNKLMVVVN